MIETPDGNVILEKGEPIPAYCCRCARFYPVALDTECSDCPWCGKIQVHAQTEFRYQGPGRALDGGAKES